MSQPLTADERELWRHLETEAGGNSILDFVPWITPTYSRPSHLLPVAQLFARAEREPVRACVSVPPRHAKTETILRAIVWYLLRHPDRTVAYVSYAADLAHTKSRICRDLAIAAGLKLRKDARKIDQWILEEGGGLIATGVGGPLVGKGCDLLIIDDPIKNREEAESETIRQKVHEWFTSSGATRVEPGGSIIVVHTRWHNDDLIGRLRADTETTWETVNLPAMNDNGAALWPERWPADELAARRRLVGEYDWASQFTGQPVPRGGTLFRDPLRYEHAAVENALILVSCDPAATAKTKADFSAYVVLAIRGRGDAMTADVLDVWRGQVEIPTLINVLREAQYRWGAPVLVEAVAGFKAVPQSLRALDGSLRVIEGTPAGDKFTRALPVAAAWNAGRIRLPASAPWLGAFLREVQTFTGVSDKHDDQVDALTNAWNAAVFADRPAERGVFSAPGLAFG